MKRVIHSICAGLLCICWTFVVFAQPAKSTASVPRLVKFSGTLTESGGKPLNGTVGVSFALYEDEQGGAPTWMETQNVQVDGSGHYTAMLGSTRNEGIPAEVFASGQGRWLGVQPQGETERPRVLLTSVPYALKAVDAETLGGLPASAYALAGTTMTPPERSVVSGAAQPEATVSVKTAEGVKPAFTSSGTTNYIPKFIDTSGDLGNSVMYQNGSNIGIGTTSPGNLLTLQTGATGYTFLENIYGSVDPGNGATRLEVGNPVSSLMLTAYGSKSPGILGGSAGVVSLAGPLLVGNAASGAPLYLYAGNSYTAPQFTLTSTGSVGIDTMTPAATLEVNGNAQVDGGSILTTGSVPVVQFPNNGSGNFSAGLGALPPSPPERAAPPLATTRSTQTPPAPSTPPSVPQRCHPTPPEATTLRSDGWPAKTSPRPATTSTLATKELRATAAPSASAA